jgi:hypothetical protein
LPAIGTGLGGPAGGAVGLLIAKALGVDSTPDAVNAALTPDAIVKLHEVDADLQKTQIEADSAAAVGQLDVDKAEASNASVFVAGWRPAIGWTCAAAFAWTFVLAPMVAYGAKLGGANVALPIMDISQLMPVLLGILGLGGMRTYEKVNGIKAGH